MLLIAGVAVAMWVIVLVLGHAAWRRKDDSFRRGLGLAARHCRTIVPRMAMALLMAGFVAELIPGEMIADWLGGESGLTGIVIAMVAGMAIPAGAIVIMPIALALLKVGIGLPQLMAFIAAWSVFAVHRIMVFELPFMGPRFVTLRLISAWPVPLLAALGTGVLVTLLGMG